MTDTKEIKLSPKRQAMEARIIDSIHTLVKTKGLETMGARDVAKTAGCSVGSIYAVFHDLDNAIFAANAQTLKDMEANMMAVDMSGSDKTALRKLARSYAEFALAYPERWKAVFLHQPQPGVKVPEWYFNLHAQLISRIVAPLRRLRSDLDEETSKRRARTMFASVHGVVQLALEQRFVGVGTEFLLEEVDALVLAMTRGLTETPND